MAREFLICSNSQAQLQAYSDIQKVKTLLLQNKNRFAKMSYIGADEDQKSPSGDYCLHQRS
jgi:hypothetical protein